MLKCLFVFLSEHAILRKAKPRLFDWQFIQTGNYGEHRKFAYRETMLNVQSFQVEVSSNKHHLLWGSLISFRI